MDAQENETMTRVGPGTPAGETLRRYWLPISFSDEIKTDEFADKEEKFIPIWRAVPARSLPQIADWIAAGKFAIAVGGRLRRPDCQGITGCTDPF